MYISTRQKDCFTSLESSDKQVRELTDFRDYGHITLSFSVLIDRTLDKLVILPNIGVGPIEELLVGMKFVLEQSTPEFLLHESLAL